MEKLYVIALPLLLVEGRRRGNKCDEGTFPALDRRSPFVLVIIRACALAGSRTR